MLKLTAILILIAALVFLIRGRTVYIGDSIIAGLDVSNNMGFSGDPTSGILARLDKLPWNTRRVYLEGGINDIGNHWDDQIVPNYRLILGKLSGKKVYVIGILPVNESQLEQSWARVTTNAKIDRLNAEIGELCVAPSCIKLPAIQLSPDHYKDGIHLTEQGYAEFKAWLPKF